MLTNIYIYIYMPIHMCTGTQKAVERQ